MEELSSHSNVLMKCVIRNYAIKCSMLLLSLLLVCKICNGAEIGSALNAGNYSAPYPQMTLNSEADLDPVVDSTPIKGWQCHCWNSTIEFDDDLECHCAGQDLLRIPQRLHKGMHRLTIASAGLTILRNSALTVYASSLRDITLTDLDEFHTIQDGAFQTIKNLRSIYISHAPKLSYLSKGVFLGLPDTLKVIRIINSGLIKIPDMRHLSPGIILHMVDLEGNQIQNIGRKTMRIQTEQLILDNNNLVSIEDSAFFGSEIGKLSFKGNTNLRIIDRSAFLGITNIQELDLSSTSLVDLPSTGLEHLEILRVQNTHSLKTIPSIYNFKNLHEAWLTHSFHCCAFKFPSRHDPSSHARRLKYLGDLQQACLSNIVLHDRDNAAAEAMGNDVSGESNENVSSHSMSIRSKRAINSDNISDGKRIKRNPLQHTFYPKPEGVTEHYSNQGLDDFGQHLENGTDLHRIDITSIQAITGAPVVFVTTDGKDAEEFEENPDFGEFHYTTADISQNRWDAMCGNLTQKKIDVRCFPMPDALNPCEDVMGSYWLRASVWVVVLLAVFGNVAVLIVLFSNRTDMSVPKFLMSHLAFADLCMGLYLLLIASIDAHSMGEYFNYAFDWQYGSGCKVAGFLTVFASHLSVFTLTIITLERWFAITHAIYLNKRIKIKPATYIMIGGWIYSALMSAFPLFGISNYSSTSICLPMEARDSLDVIYLVAILGINGIAFFIIAICYAKIYFSLGKETRRAARTASTGEMTVAKKMALLVFTNFSCWAPIGFFGLTALAGYPLINVTKSKILLVFFYPLNSCADPYLYAILTAQYRRDLYLLLARFGICTKKAQQYKASFSLPETNHTYPVPLVTGTPLSPNNPKPDDDRRNLNEDFV